MNEHGPFGGLLANLTRVRDARSARVSSYDHTGRNGDWWVLMPGETAVLADLEGPGCITHLWMTQYASYWQGPEWHVIDPDYYRKVLLKMYWDGQEHPSVLVPLGDFFCLGHSVCTNFSCIPFAVSARPAFRNKFGGQAALNCYLQMPFNRRARIELENQGENPLRQYFYVDYELYREPMGDDIAYFHAQWRRENPCAGWGTQIRVGPGADIPNLDGAGNYVILEATGRGHYIGCNLSVTNLLGTWWGEGDDMIFIDGEAWPPSLHGTGSEDYFCHGWGMQDNAFPMSGSSLHSDTLPGYQVSYRFHLVDPVRFSQSIRVTMEHGHANHLANDWASTAYWYQTLPSQPFGILPVEQRLPIRLGDLGVIPILPAATPQPVDLNDDMRQAHAAYRRATAENEANNQKQQLEHAEKSRSWSQACVEQARRIRAAFRRR